MRPLKGNKPAIVADAHVKCEAAIREEFMARKAAEQRLKAALEILAEIRYRLDEKWSAFPEGRTYLAKMDRVLYG